MVYGCLIALHKSVMVLTIAARTGSRCMIEGATSESRSARKTQLERPVGADGRAGKTPAAVLSVKGDVGHELHGLLQRRQPHRDDISTVGGVATACHGLRPMPPTPSRLSSPCGHGTLPPAGHAFVKPRSAEHVRHSCRSSRSPQRSYGQRHRCLHESCRKSARPA